MYSRPADQTPRSALLDRAGDALAGQRQVADAHPGRVGDRVADGPGDRPLGDFARTGLGLAGRVHDPHHDVRNLSEPEDRVAIPARRGDLVPVEPDLLAQRPAGALHGAAFDLVDHPVRVDDPAHVRREPQPAQPDIRIGRYLGYGGAVPGVSLVTSHRGPVADAVAAGPGRPSGHVRGLGQDLPGPRVVEVGQ